MAEVRDVQLLDANTANQIAAGEVVEKPASVVKELVENALDAGADNVRVVIYEGGIEYIRVEDNGSGMTEANARLAVLRHATSKISAAGDLLSLRTLGFRGEALPSIASVARFTLLTRPAGSDLATSIRIDGGRDMECSQAGGNAGTTVIVENLFFNVPARRKFLKTPPTEGRYISELLTKLALSRPDVRFKLLNADKEVLATDGNGELKDTIRALYGKNVVAELLSVNFADSSIRISGFISKPTLLRGTRQWQTLLVNGRIISSRMLASAIDHAYQSQIPKSGFPFAVLNIEVDTASIDVNVHPQKSEIKFSDDNSVYKAVYKALTEALTRPVSAVQAGMTLLEDSELHAFMPPSPKATPAGKASTGDAASRSEYGGEIFKSRPSMAGAGSSLYAQENAPVFSISETREAFGADEPFSAPAAEIIAFTDTDNGVDNIWPIGQVDKTFIVAQSESSLYLIDQHAAHERILYDKLVALKGDVPAQQLLLPLYINLRAQDIALIEEHREEFLRLGVDVAAAGEDMLRVSSLPADISADDAEDFINEISKMLGEMRAVTPADLRQNVLHMTACKAAIKAGQLLNTRQMRQLIISLCNTEHPFTCPHGRPCMIEIDSAQLCKMFKRTGF